MYEQPDKPCPFCNRMNFADALECELCKKRFPLPKLAFGTKAQCIRSAVLWTSGVFILPPAVIAILPRVDFLPALAIWTVFIAIILGVKYWSNGGSFKEQTIKSNQGKRPIMTLEFLLMGINRMIYSWEDLSRHL